MRSTAFFLVFVISSAVAAQVTWHIDANGAPGGNGSAASPYTAIQTAMVAAQSGDTVLVAPGTYHQNVSFLGKSIVLRSLQGAASTTIVSTVALGSTVRFVGGESAATVLDGFTITGGTGVHGFGLPPTEAQGGGIDVNGASPRIVNCVVTGNTGGTSGDAPFLTGGGGGISVRSTFPSSTPPAPEISDCVVSGNVGSIGAINSRGGGGGIQASPACMPLVRRTLISANQGGRGA